MRPLPEAAVARFGRDLLRLVAQAFDGGTPPGEGRIALAVSGGPDSMAMLRLATAAMPGRVTVATVDHRLRAESAMEARLVAEVCAALRVPHRTLVPAAPITGNSVQMRARDARYAALTAWAGEAGVAMLLTAHHADDQAETLLMRLRRASGLGGLAAIRAVRSDPFGVVLRPLLGWRRAELRALVEESATPFVDDPSNDDPRHDRTAIRALLAATPALDPVALAASAGFLAEADEVLSQFAERIWATCWHGAGQPLPAAGEPREVRRRLLRRAIASTRTELGISRPDFRDSANVEGVLDALETGRAATQAGILIRPARDGWIFCAAPPRRSV